MQAESERRTREPPKGEQRIANPLQAVVLIEPSRAPRRRAGAMLQRLGFAPRLAEDAFEAHALVDATSAVVATHPSAADIYPRLCAAGIPLIAAFSSKAVRPNETARKIGADAYIVKPYRSEQLAAALHAAEVARVLRERAVRAEHALTEVDRIRGGRLRLPALFADAQRNPSRGLRLSGGQTEPDRAKVLGIDFFRALLPLEIRRARRHKYPIAICVVAFDPPPEAHHLLPEVVTACEPRLRATVRDVDLMMRYGEGRFLVFLPHTDAKGADALGSRIVKEIRGSRFRVGGCLLAITASVGIAAPRSGKPPAFSRLIRDAHTALKAAQLKGGDRAILR